MPPLTLRGAKVFSSASEELEGVADTTGGADSVGFWVAVGSGASVELGAAELLGLSEVDGDGVGEDSAPVGEVSEGLVALGVPGEATGASVPLGVGSTKPEDSGDSAPLLGVSGECVDAFDATLDSVGAAISDAVARDGVSIKAAITTLARPRLIRVAHSAGDRFIPWIELCRPSCDAPAEAFGGKVFLLRRGYVSTVLKSLKAIVDSDHSGTGPRICVKQQSIAF